MRKKYKTIQFVLIILAVAVLIMPVLAHAEVRSWWTAVFPQDNYQKTYFEAQARELLKQVEMPENATFHQRADSIRTFINENSLHKPDKEFYTYWHDVPRLMAMLGAHAEDNQSYKPHFECSSRTAVMYWMLKANDIRSRMVVIYPDEDVMDSHTFLEALNPETGKWEIQDADYNVFWTYNDSGQRASIFDLMTYPVADTFVTCRAPEDCSYTDYERKMLPDRFDIASIIDIDANYHPLVFNPARASPDNPFITNMPPLMYCTLFKDTCYQEIISVGGGGGAAQQN